MATKVDLEELVPMVTNLIIRIESGNWDGMYRKVEDIKCVFPELFEEEEEEDGTT